MDSAENYFKTYLNYYTRCFSGLMVFFAIYYYFVVEHMVLAGAGFIFAPITFAIPYIYRKTGAKGFITNFTIFNTFIFITVIILCTGGINSWILTWYIVGPIVSGLLAGNRALYIWGLFVLLSIFLMKHYDPFIQQLPFQITDPEILARFKIRALIVPLLLSIVATSLYINLMGKWGEEVVNKNKSIRNLLRLVSHDIANPLTVIMGTTSMQLRRHTDPESKEFKAWNRLSIASGTIRKILNQVRQMQAIESGKMEIPLTAVELKKVFDKGSFIFQDKLEKRNINLVFELPDESLSVVAEETSFSNQVLNNILSNAIKFSHDNDTVTVKVKPKEDLIYLMIRDQGIGIPDEILNKLFDENAKTSRKGVSGEEGTGFGMPLVKFFMDKYGGDITVKSKVKEEGVEDHGTEFTLILKKANS